LQVLEREYGYMMNGIDDIIFDEIAEQEEEHEMMMEVTPNFKEKTAIGIYTKYRNDFIYSHSISPSTFFKYPYITILKYLLLSSFFEIRRIYRNVEILQLIYIHDDEPLLVVCKTYWIRLIQRHWKRIYSEKKHIIDRRKQLRTIKYFEINGKYPEGLNYVPTIRGMLSVYGCNKYTI
jgi:hypothetical protein